MPETEYSGCYESSQEEFDADAFIADINAIVSAPRREPTL